LRFEFDEILDSRRKIILKKIAFTLGIFVFETFIPWLTGFQMILALFANYFIATLMSLFRAIDLAEYMLNDLRAAVIIGAVFIILLHVLYHIIVRGLFRVSLKIEMGIELFAVFLFLSLTENDIMAMAEYMFLIAACAYAIIQAAFFAVKYLKYLKHKKHTKDKNLL
jgi:hypothetical protein